MNTLDPYLFLDVELYCMFGICCATSFSKKRNHDSLPGGVQHHVVSSKDGAIGRDLNAIGLAIPAVKALRVWGLGSSRVEGRFRHETHGNKVKKKK